MLQEFSIMLVLVTSLILALAVLILSIHYLPKPKEKKPEMVKLVRTAELLVSMEPTKVEYVNIIGKTILFEARLNYASLEYFKSPENDKETLFVSKSFYELMKDQFTYIGFKEPTKE